jgi:hypothetical protein
MTIPLPDDVVDALNELSLACANHNLKLDQVNIQRVKTKPYVQAYLLHTPVGVVTVKQEMA